MIEEELVATVLKIARWRRMISATEGKGREERETTASTARRAKFLIYKWSGSGYRTKAMVRASNALVNEFYRRYTVAQTSSRSLSRVKNRAVSTGVSHLGGRYRR